MLRARLAPVRYVHREHPIPPQLADTARASGRGKPGASARPDTASSSPTRERIATPFHCRLAVTGRRRSHGSASSSPSSSANASSASLVSCRQTTSGCRSIQPRQQSGHSLLDRVHVPGRYSHGTHAIGLARPRGSPDGMPWRDAAQSVPDWCPPERDPGLLKDETPSLAGASLSSGGPIRFSLPPPDRAAIPPRRLISRLPAESKLMSRRPQASPAPHRPKDRLLTPPAGSGCAWRAESGAPRPARTRGTRLRRTAARRTRTGRGPRRA